jgi:long-chain acyl-CoA synthetase
MIQAKYVNIGPDIVGAPGAELFFLARNSHGLGGRFARAAAAWIPSQCARLRTIPGHALRMRIGASLLRGMSRDRLELLGEEYLDSFIRRRLARLNLTPGSSRGVVLATHALEPVARALAIHLGVEQVCCNRLEYRDGIATGRILDPIVLPDAPSPEHEWSAHAVEARRCSPRRVVFGDVRPRDLSIQRAFAGRTILLIGVTGFIGKVFLAKLLHDLPETGRVIVLVRAKGKISAADRVARIIDRSPLFDIVRNRHGDAFDRFVREKIEIFEGDVGRPDLGLDAQARRRICDSVDLVVNCAGLTEFNPDLRLALRINVEAPLHLLELVRSSSRAALLHLSTCFAAGSREGRIRESAFSQAPSGAPFDSGQERSMLHAWIRKETEAGAAENGAGGRRVRDRLLRRGLARARELGWPNIYTYTKGLAEALLEKRGADLPLTVVRPSIVESARGFPFRGWNEGINTSAPLSYVLGRWFRQLPVRRRKRLDVIPVDDVVRGMTIAGAALLERRAPRFIQLATSSTHPLDMGRTVELTALAHRRHYNSRPGWKSWTLARMEAIPVSPARYRMFSVPAWAMLVKTVNRALRPVFGSLPILRRFERSLVRLHKLVELYEPFILRSEQVFEADMIERLADLLPPEERETFGYDVRSIDWAQYWTRIHIPGLRRWSYPLIEGREPITRARRILPSGAREVSAPARRIAELLPAGGGEVS